MSFEKARMFSTLGYALANLSNGLPDLISEPSSMIFDNISKIAVSIGEPLLVV